MSLGGSEAVSEVETVPRPLPALTPRPWSTTARRGITTTHLATVPALFSPYSGHLTARAADRAMSGRRVPFLPWVTERESNPRCFDRVRFDSVPDDPRGGNRRATTPQQAWEARRKHAPCGIRIPPDLGMDCLYLREEQEEDYVRRLAEFTRKHPRVPEGDVSREVICSQVPLLPLRWPMSGRKTENPIEEFSPRGGN
jgi:hypothetical protein